jgi:hypothetical protein
MSPWAPTSRAECAARAPFDVDWLASEVVHHQIEPAHRDVDRERFALFAQPDEANPDHQFNPAIL